MKVLTVNTMLDPVAGGGTAERTFQMSRFLAMAGVDCTVLTLDIGLRDDRLTELRPAKACVLHCYLPRFYLFRLPEPRIAQLVRESDIVHLMGHWTVLNALVARAARKAGKPYVVCPAGALPIYGRSRWLKAIYNAVSGKKLIRHAAAHVAIASNEMAHFAAYGIAAGNITLIPNGIDPAAFDDSDELAFRSQFKLPAEPFVLFLGRLNSIKGPDLLLEAFLRIAALHPRVHLVFAGPDGGLLGSLRAMAGGSSVAGRVHFTGPLHGADKSRACHSAALLAVPSRQEAMSIVALEGGICGTPVLITDQCGFEDIASSGGGMIVPASVDGLQRGLDKLLSAEVDLRAMGIALREFTRRHYLWETVVKRYLDLFGKLGRVGA